MANKCNICKVVLINDPSSFAHNCGGDCLKCMSESGDPDCQAMVALILFNELCLNIRKIVNTRLDKFPNEVEKLVRSQLAEQCRYWKED